MKYLVMSALFLISCGNRHEDWYYGELSPEAGNAAHEALYYHWLFKQDCIKYTQALCDDEVVAFHFVHHFGKMDSHIGEAQMNKSITGKLTARKIAYLLPWWESATVTAKKTLVYHELGHALLKYQHTDDDKDIDIMNESLPYIKESEFERYVYKLFTK